MQIPNFKDFNDDLKIAKAMNLDFSYTKEKVHHILKEWEKHSEFLNRSWHILKPEAKRAHILEINLKEIPLFIALKPKIENYLPTKSLEKSYENLEARIKKEREREAMEKRAMRQKIHI